MRYKPEPEKGSVQFHFSLKVDMEQMMDWPYETVLAIYEGIAKVIAANGGKVVDHEIVRIESASTAEPLPEPPAAEPGDGAR